MPLFGNSSDVVGDVIKIFLDNKDEATSCLLAKLKSRHPSLTHEDRIRVLRQVREQLA